MAVPMIGVPLQRVNWRMTLPIAAALALGAGILIIIWLTARAIALLLVAIAIAEALEPIVMGLHRWIPRNLAVVLVYTLFLVVLGLIGWLVIPVLVNQLQALSTRAPELIAQARAGLAQWDQITGGRLAKAITSGADSLSETLITVPMMILSVLVDIALVLFLSIYWLVGAPSLKRFALSLFPLPRREKAGVVMSDMGQAMGGYVRGAAINAVIMGALAWLGLHLIGVNYALVLGVLTMLGEPIPYIGPIVVAIPVVGVALLQSPGMAVLALVLYTVLEQFEGHILTPNIMERQTAVPQTLVIFAIAAGAALGGVLGIVAAIPTAAALHVFALRVVAPMERREVGADRAPAPVVED
jgi:predicted PurR-regulated permease PerM